MDRLSFLSTSIEEKDDGLYLGDMCLVYKAEREIHRRVIRRMCERLKPKSVIEIGFGLGDSCDAFQEYGLEKHIIIEPHPEIYKRAVIWAKDKKGIQIIKGFYQEVKIEERVDLVYEDVFELVEFKDFTEFRNPFKSTYCERFMGDMFTPKERNELTPILTQNYDGTNI